MSCCHGLSLRQDPLQPRAGSVLLDLNYPGFSSRASTRRDNPWGCFGASKLSVIPSGEAGAGRSCFNSIFSPSKQQGGLSQEQFQPSEELRRGCRHQPGGHSPLCPSKTNRTGTSPRQELLLPESVLKNKTWQVPSSHVKNEKASQARLVSAGVCRPGWQQEGPQQAGALHFVRIQPLELSSPSDG